MRRKALTATAVLLLAIAAFTVSGSAIRAESPRKPQERTLPTTAEDTPATTYASLEPLRAIGTYKVTAYCGCVKCCGIWSAQHPERVGTGYQQRTASGTIPKAEHTVAADTSVLPFGTEIVIEGRIYTVEDTGSAVNGKHIDIYMDDHHAALECGVQYIEVYREAT
jgi:3D (Asp-Asp-Asp) domain-containing protein